MRLDDLEIRVDRSVKGGESMTKVLAAFENATFTDGLLGWHVQDGNASAFHISYESILAFALARMAGVAGLRRVAAGWVGQAASRTEPLTPVHVQVAKQAKQAAWADAREWVRSRDEAQLRDAAAGGFALIGDVAVDLTEVVAQPHPAVRWQQRRARHKRA